MFDPLAELFAPGRRHTEEELRRQALTREDPGDADPSRGPIDLTSGRVTIRAPRPAAGDVTAGRGAGGSERGVEEVETVGQGGGLAPAGDAELGEDVGDVDAGRLG
ncbi:MULTISPECIES: DUF6191 domain-containing protein [unclassified Streptomyces]|uniref:DUF6191 domain-containing protein n=1 Tax=unclassified Streptomyces TaxID=2593676 RepID=UPI002967093D|nr:DUF6191 domain-containing protein [Streptomyces sp. SJL17-1]